jgi:hypothetical protein
MFDKIRKGAFLLMLAGLAVAILTGGTAAAASNQPAVKAPAGPRDAATGISWVGDSDAPLAILYNQLDNPGASIISSQNFEAAYDAYDSFGADDFVVPPNTSWTIKGVGINGGYYTCGMPGLPPCGPAASFNVFFHVDNGGLPKDPPAATRANMTYVEDPPGTFKIKIAPSITIPASPSPRHVWVSVQGNLDFGVGGQFGWGDRAVQSNDPAAWQNPGGGFGVCPDWGVMTGCIGSLDPDFQFALVGTHTP